MSGSVGLSSHHWDMRAAFLAVVLSLALASVVVAQAPRDTALARELLARGHTDQAIRDTMVKRLQAGQTLDSLFGVRMLAIDSANTAWLKTVVDRHGWPGRSLVGAEAANSAFLIVQHAVFDTAFQSRALALMERAAASGDVPGVDVATLGDRLAVQRGQPQRYGTQAKLRDGRIVLDPIADSAHVDERRAALGMPPLKEYVRVLDSLYTAPPKAR